MYGLFKQLRLDLPAGWLEVQFRSGSPLAGTGRPAQWGACRCGRDGAPGTLAALRPSAGRDNGAVNFALWRVRMARAAPAGRPLLALSENRLHWRPELMETLAAQ